MVCCNKINPGILLAYWYYPHNTLNSHTQDKKCSLTKAFDDGCHLPLFCCPSDVVGDVVRDDDDEAPPLAPLLGLSPSALFSMMLSQTGGKLYLPLYLLRLRFRALIYMTSFKSSFKPDSVVKILVLSNSTE